MFLLWKKEDGGIFMVSEIKIPKYSQYQITELVKMKSEGHALNNELLQDIIQGEVIFKVKHYELASEILEVDMEEFFLYDLVRPTYFRNQKELDSLVEKRIEEINLFFTNVSLLRKINGII
ncbi:hypothetical protein Q876_08830 [Listeria monocytogenes]|nr:hypothetical protein [Listeria monocytogenes]